MAGAGSRGTGRHRRMELGRTSDQMVRGADPEQGGRPPDGLDIEGGERHRGGCVAALGLEQQMVRGGRIQGDELPAHLHRLPLGRHGQKAALGRDPGDPPCGLLQKRGVAEKRHQMLRQGGPAFRPEPGARAAGQNDRHEIGDDGRGQWTLR
jgi:hypothetical protein